MTPYARRLRPVTLVRVGEAIIHCAALAARDPSEAVSLLQSLGAAVLADRLARRSPIPPLPAPLASSLSTEVILPPGRLWQPGSQDVSGLIHLVGIARALDAELVLEIGTFTGLSALTLAMNLPAATVHTLDLPPGQHPVLPIAGHDSFLLESSVARVYEGRPEAGHIVQHYGDSATYDYSPLQRSCQVVYVDGAHSWDYLVSDTSAAFRVVAAQGAIVWDDYWRPAPDVVRYLDSRSRDLKLWRLPGSRLVAWFSDSALAWLLADKRP